MIGQTIVGILALMIAFVAGMLCQNIFIRRRGYMYEDIVFMSSEVLQKYNQETLRSTRND